MMLGRARPPNGPPAHPAKIAPASIPVRAARARLSGSTRAMSRRLSDVPQTLSSRHLDRRRGQTGNIGGRRRLVVGARICIHQRSRAHRLMERQSDFTGPSKTSLTNPSLRAIEQLQAALQGCKWARIRCLLFKPCAVCGLTVTGALPIFPMLPGSPDSSGALTIMRKIIGIT